MSRYISQDKKTQIKDEADYKCRHCGLEDETGQCLIIDHIVPYSQCGISPDYDLQSLCWGCNGEKSDSMPKVMDVVQPNDEYGESSQRINLADRFRLDGFADNEGFDGLSKYGLW